ncbi:MAG: FxsA family protein [Alkalispirochaeta sp.]
MPQAEWLSSFTSRRHLVHFLSDILLLGLAMLADGWILVRVARAVGVYFALALEGVVAAVAVLVVGSTINRQIRLLHQLCRKGDFQPKQFARLAAYIVAGVLLVLPGFATDGLGLLLYIPPGRTLFEVMFARNHRERLPAVYEYFTLAVYSDDTASTDDGR